jgi:hypothetical protein
LDLPAQLNIKADSLADQQRRLMKHPKTSISVVHRHLKVDGKYFTKDLQRHLLESASRVPIQQYYRDKLGWSNQVFNDIQWDLQSKVLGGYNINDQRRILKFVHGWLPTNKRLHRENKSPHQRCPMCFYIVEDDLHLMNCKHPAQAATVQEMIGKLRKDLQCSDQAKQVLINIIQMATKEKSEMQTIMRSSQKEILKGAEAQQRIRWEQVIYGRMARAFVLMMAPVHSENDSQSLSSASQGKKCIRIIWDTFLTLWRHRNEFIYGHIQESKKAALLQVIEMKVNQCYDGDTTCHLMIRDKYSKKARRSCCQRTYNTSSLGSAWLNE